MKSNTKKTTAKTETAPMTAEQVANERETQIEYLSYELKEKCAVLGIMIHSEIMTGITPDHPADLKRDFETLRDALNHIGPAIIETSNKLDKIVRA